MSFERHKGKGEGMKCLLVDDDEFNRDYIRTLLGEGVECREAENGQMALEMFSEGITGGNPFDLIILDIMMPGMNGHETARAIRELEKERGLEAGKRVNIVMLTALNSPRDAMEAFCSAQSAAYLVKPVSREKLVDIISKLGLMDKR
jgi:two-component system, chemotaxis family, chemotaxis protein CheY